MTNHGKPYIDNGKNRTFLQDIDDSELKWHKDNENRFIKPINETDWMVQLDNKLPENFNNGILIKKGVWHRVIKGTSDLTVEINYN